MGSMQFDAVEPGHPCTADGSSEGVAQRRQVVLARLNRHDACFGIRHGRRPQNALAGRIQPRGRTAVRHLQDEACARLVHDVDQFAVLVHKAVIVDAHHARIGLFVRDDVGIAGQDGAHAARCQLPIDFQQLRRHASLVGRQAFPRGRPDEAILRPQRAKGDPVEQRARSRCCCPHCFRCLFCHRCLRCHRRCHRSRFRCHTCLRSRANALSCIRFRARFLSHAPTCLRFRTCIHICARFYFNSSTARATDSEAHSIASQEIT